MSVVILCHSLPLFVETVSDTELQLAILIRLADHKSKVSSYFPLTPRIARVIETLGFYRGARDPNPGVLVCALSASPVSCVPAP